MLTPEQVIPAALAAGLITPADIVQGAVEVHSIGRSHPVARLSVGGVPRLVFKSFAPRRGDTDGELVRELAVAALGAEIPALGRLLAPQIAWDGDDVIVHGHVAGQTPWRLDGVGGSEIAGELLDWAGLVAAVAGPLAALHRATASLARPGAAVPACLRVPMPWGLRLFDGDGPADLWASPPLRAVLRRLAASPAIVAGTRRARAAWRERCLVHGDLKHDNLLVARAGADDAQVTLIDWEMARLGDPAWDLAGLLVRLVLADAPGPAWPAATVAAAALLCDAYAAAAGMAPAPVAQRVVLFTGAWLQMTALQYLSVMGGAAPEAQLEPMLTAAATTLAEADAITRAVLESIAAGPA